MCQSAQYQSYVISPGGPPAVSKAPKKPLLKLLFLSLPFFAFTPAHALDPKLHISQYGHSTWRMGGSSNSVPFTIVQSMDGYMWFGTPAGLARFDGMHFDLRPSELNLLSSKIYALAAARDGSLWIGTDNGLAHWVNRKLIRYAAATGSVFAILEDHNGRIWFTNNDENTQVASICVVVGQGARCYGKADGVIMQNGYQLAQDGAGELWSTEPSGVVRWKPGSFSTYKVSKLNPAFVVDGVNAVAPTPEGPVWVGMVKAGPGLGLQQLEEGKWKSFISAGFDSSTLSVTCLLLDREGALWIGTQDKGLYRIRGLEVEQFSNADGLSSDNVNKIYEDREGNLWVGTIKGFDCFHELRVTTFPSPKGVGSEADGVLASRDGTVWVARYASLDAIREGKVVSLKARKGLPGEQVTSLLEDHEGRLWVGIDRTLSIYENGEFHVVRRRSGSPLGLVVGLAEDVENNVWAEVSGSPRTLFRIRDLQVQEEFPAPGMPAARKLAADPQGGVWLGLFDGNLARYRNGHLEYFSYPHNGRNAYVKQLTIGPDGMVLGATPTGLIAWKNKKQAVLNVRNGLPCENVFSQVFDNEGRLWLYTECGLIEIASSELQRWWHEPEAKLQTRVLDALDGVQAGDPPFNGAARTPDGRLWFVNAAALQMIDPSREEMNRIEPPVRIEQLIADRKSYSILKNVRLPPLTRDLEIDYTGLSFVVPEKVRFRYKLEDHDADWQEPDTRRQAFYTDLSPGKYRFRVIACNNDGVWNEQGATLDFYVAPTWYQTNWFRLSCFAAFFLLLWTLYRFRLHQVAMEFNTKVEASVEERTRIARELHDTLLQSLHGLMFRVQAARNMLPRRPEEAMQALDGAITRTELAIAESRDAIKDLRVVPAVQNDIAEALTAIGQELLSSQEGDSGLPAFNVTVEGKPRPLSSIVQDETCRIAREVLTNSFRHAEALRIEAEIRYDRHSVQLRFRDDGKGINQEVLQVGGRPGHWGLPGIFERAQRISAKLDFWSEAGAGTEIQLTIPAAYEKSSAGTRFGFARRWRNREQ